MLIYKDDDILVINKPAGIPVETKSITAKDCESEIKKMLAKEGKTNPYIAVINRLDQPVNGLVLFALNPKAAAKLSDDLQKKKIEKYYHARIYGEFEAKEGTLTDVLYKDAKNNLSRVVKEGDLHFKEGKKAVLEYREESRGELDIKLITGRHHQIRVQLANAGHPILGDLKYGSEASKAESDKLGIKTLQLTSYKLKFRHPSSGNTVEFKL